MIPYCPLRCLFLYPLLVLSASWLLGQSSPADSSLLVYDLTGLTVAASASQLPIAAPVARLNAAAIARYDNTSLVASLNSLAGVRLEERSPGSYRVSIRGSSLRAPFGVRNVKIYWNGLPLTEPGGDTYLNFLDPTNVQDALVFKGPAGSLYGSGTGGAILLNSRSHEGEAAQDELSLQGASFGGLRANWQHSRSQSPNSSHQIRLAHQRSDGYRNHSSFERSVGELSLYQKGPRGGGSSYHVLATDLHYEIPGGLNPTQFAENPRQARPGSEAAQAAINYQNLLVGGRFFGQLLAGKIRHQSSIFASANVFDHPFNNDHKRERNLGVGLRSTLHYDRELPQLGQLALTAGLEVQVANKAARNYAPNAGRPGELNFIDDIVSYQSLLFAQGVLDFQQGWQLTAGLSAQQLQYRVDRSFSRTADIGIQASDFQWVWAPRLSLAKAWSAVSAQQTYSAFLSYALAYAPPTLSEFRTNEGSINTQLAPEQGHSLEAGLRRNSALGFDVELNIYYQWLLQSIATYQDDSGVQLFRNSGGSQQVGIEIAVERELLSPKAANHFINSLLARLAYTYTQGQYSGYQVNEQDFSGQALPGLTPSTLDLQLSLHSPSHFYANLGLYSAAKTPLNDANEVFSNAFTLVRARIGKNFQWKNLPMEIYIGGDNLLNENYSLGYDLNPQFGRRFFQPAPGINFFVGWRGNF